MQSYLDVCFIGRWNAQATRECKIVQLLQNCLDYVALGERYLYSDVVRAQHPYSGLNRLVGVYEPFVRKSRKFSSTSVIILCDAYAQGWLAVPLLTDGKANVMHTGKRLISGCIPSLPGSVSPLNCSPLLSL